MIKIPSLYLRDHSVEGNPLTRNINPLCDWVIRGEGVATRKWDGTACLVRAGKLYRRHDVKAGKTRPANWEPCIAEPDPHTGHWPGWLPVVAGDPQSKWHWAIWSRVGLLLNDGTYELCGPHFNANPDQFPEDTLVRHGVHLYPSAPTSFDSLRAWLSMRGIEGLVWHAPDGRMAKIKRRDFGLEWPVKL